MTKRLCAFLFLFGLIMGWPARAAAAERHQVPLRFYGTRPAVEVRVNGQGPFLFLIDTGAAGPPARADASLVRRLSLTPKGTAKASDAGQSAVTIDQVVLDSVEFGGLAFRNVAALSRDYGTQAYLPQLDGILGLNFFREWLLTIDYARGQLVMEKGQLPTPNQRSILGYELIDGNAYIPATLGKRPVKLLLDTGNIRGLDLPSAWIKPLRMASFPRLAGNSTSVSGTIPIREVQLADPLQIGMHAIPKPSITFADDFGEANLGSSILQDFVITLDQQNHRVRLLRP